MKNLISITLSLFVLLGSSLAIADDAQTVAELKAEILQLSQSYLGQADADGSKTKSLEVLIERLLAVSPTKTMQEKAVDAVGAWKQVWGPYIYNNAAKTMQAIDPANIYQIISANGTYTNVGVYNILGVKVVGLLKGKYTVTDAEVEVQFIQDGVMVQKLPKGYSLADLPALKEKHKLCVLEFPNFIPPVGIHGALREVYSDDSIRITYGTQQGQPGESLYVLSRVKALNY